MRIQSTKAHRVRRVGHILVVLLLISAGLVRSANDIPASVLHPIALAGRDTTALVGEPLEFFGYGSSPDDEIVSYAWDFDSDGIVDFTSTQTGQVRRQFDEAGDYECIFTVSDSAGRTATDSRRVRVVAEQTELSTDRPMRTRQVAASAPADGNRRWYAVILNGGYDERYWRDVELAYDMLRNGYGFSAGDIYVLNYNGLNPSGQNPDGMIDYQAKVEYIERVFNELAGRADADDELIILITGHGYGYNGPLSQGGQYLGYNSGRISVDPGDEPDFIESDFKLRSLFTGGDYRCNHGLYVWAVRKQYTSARGTEYYRNKFVSQMDEVYIEDAGGPVSDNDIYIERLVDYLLGDTNRDGYVDTAAGETFDFDADGRQPYDYATGQFDEDDWGPIDKMEDNYNNIPCVLPEGGYPQMFFDEGLAGKICIDLAYAGAEPQVDGRDEDGEGLFDWLDVNGDGDTNDIISIDESIYLAAGEIYDDELADLIDQLSVARITVAALPCFSGGLVDDLSGPGRVVCTATIEEAVSWGDVFFRGFVAALHGKDEYGASVNADTNGNGHISMLEAFNYSSGHDYYDEIPQYDDNGDGLSNTDPVPAGGDGRLGCQTYLTPFRPGNLNGDSNIDLADFAELAVYWLQNGCGQCGYADLTCDEQVDCSDLQEFATYWLASVE